MSNLEVLKINFKNICNDFKSHSVDVYVAKIEIESIIKKLIKIQKEQSNVLKSEINEMLINAKKLLEEVNHEISLQAKEEYFKFIDNAIEKVIQGIVCRQGRQKFER